jgi:hypothetical protein
MIVAEEATMSEHVKLTSGMGSMAQRLADRQKNSGAGAHQNRPCKPAMELSIISAAVVNADPCPTRAASTTRRNAREWLEAALNGEVILTPQQFACAKVLIEYEEPKLGRVGALPDAVTFAVQLEKAIERSGIGEVIDITPKRDDD